MKSGREFVDHTPNLQVGDMVRGRFMEPGVFGIVMGLDCRDDGTTMVNLMWHDSKGSNYIEGSWLWAADELEVISSIDPYGGA